MSMLKKFLSLADSGSPEATTVKYPGVRDAVDGNTAVIHVEREASDAAGAYPITPSTQMGEYWAEEVAAGHLNISDKPLVFIEPESEHAAAGVTAGMSMTGLRAVNFSSGQGVAFMHESLYAAVGKRLPYVLNMGCRAITKASLNVHAGHDDYHCIDDTGFIQVMAKNATEAADLNLIGRKVAELSLTPAIIGQDGFLTTHLIESALLPERELVAEFCGKPDDIIDTPTPAQTMLYGPKRRRVPAIWDVDNPLLSGSVQNQDAYMQATAGQRPYFFDHIEQITDACMEEYASLTGRRYGRVATFKIEDADWLIVGQGSMIVQAEGVADYLRETRKLKVGVVNLTMFRPFPGDLLGHALRGKKGVVVLERTDQPLAEDLPLMREVRATVTKCLENGMGSEAEKPYPDYASYAPNEMPRLYSGCYGLGSRDMQPEALIGAIENMLPEGAKRKFFYLSIDFVRDPLNPKDEIHQQDLAEKYPHIGELAVRGSENPNLLPKGAITVRMHSVGGWGAITTGKNLAVTLFELLGYDIKANPKYGSEKKGQPTTYYLSAAPEPIRINCEYVYVDVVLSPDPNVFGHSNPLSGLKKGGTFIIQSNLGEATWASFPLWAQKFIVDNDIHVFYLDAFQIAREEAGSPELQLRMQGNVFQGAFFAASPVMQNANLTEDALFTAIENQLQAKFGGKGKRVVDSNLRVVRRGFTELTEITAKEVGATQRQLARKDAGLPIMLRQLPETDGKVADIHRFWEQTGHFYATGKGNDNLVDPFIGASLVPAATGVFRDMTGIRFEHPVWNAANCTACGNCYTECPDSAIPGLVNTVSDVFNSAINRIETGGTPTRYLRRAARTVEKKLRGLITGDGVAVRPLIDEAIAATVAEAAEDDRARMADEFKLFTATLGDFQFGTTKPYWTQKEKKAKGSGGLFSITVNPYTCKACALCVTVCEDDALKMVTQTDASVDRLRQDWNFWLDLPTTGKEYSRIDNLDEKIGALETLLLDKQNYNSMNCGDGACLGCGEKTAIHLFTSTVSALMQPRVRAFVERIDDLIVRLEQHMRIKLAAAVDLSDAGAVVKAVEATGYHDLTLSNLAAKLGEDKPSQPLDPVWVKNTAQLLEKLKDLKWRYVEGPSKRGRADMGVVNSTGCTSVWGSTYPFHPYPFPWTSHLFQDSPSVAMGIFEGHMAKMADGFKAVRRAEKELAGDYLPDRDDDFFRRFDWHKFSADEWELCPPVVSIGGDGAMYDIGFQNLSRALMSGMPIKVLVVDTQVYSNTGGQACTSGFISQVSDMAPFGVAQRGKQETRKEISLIGMAHRTSYVMSGTIAHPTHLLESYIDGLNSRRPALFNIYAVCPPEHGVGDDRSVDQSKLAVEGRAYPLFRFDPDAGITFSECVSLEGNPAPDEDWPTYILNYIDDLGAPATMTLPMTFADFAATEARFSKQFRKAPPETWNDDMMLLADFLQLDKDEREGKFPYIWAVDGKNRLMRLLVTEDLARAAEERLNFWRQLRDIAATGRGAEDSTAVAERVRAELMAKITASLGMVSSDAVQKVGAGDTASAGHGGNGAAEGYEPVWVESPECTACDECTTIAPKTFAYNEQKQATVTNPKGTKYADLVKAAEKCTAGCLHPGTPWNLGEPGIEKLIARAAKYN
ncbi:2-oxoacid:acceptor oxidoreductase family protein [Sulfurisoma sediminicola]|uniref:Pyruvate-ferredoxin/flavodoxin oxidoreductase n=1 Tax=Sulfurisoma sediminicola TaxID=1381557 RepID=A0A497XKN9_9PROT|nr:2-oxoacid:acceptor oxidoreductase family protein [Sulfurisoma sediminicola]RLJ68454.1 pyruvate-ferredoxin/flavodoxin oxidoreductase [Sulfurisoma sediminicola]